MRPPCDGKRLKKPSKTARQEEVLDVEPPFLKAVAAHERGLMGYLLRLTRDREDARDLFQETWLRAYKGYPRLDSGRELRPWLFRIATNLYRNWARDRHRRWRKIAAAQQRAQADARTSHAGHEPIAAVMLAFAKLPRRQAQALALRRVAGLDYSTIAAALACSPQTARATVYQAMRKLREAW